MQSNLHEVDSARNMDELKSSDSILGRKIQTSRYLIQKLRESTRKSKKAQQDNPFLKGRHIDYMIYDHFKSSGTGEALLDCYDPSRVQLKNVNAHLSVTIVPESWNNLHKQLRLLMTLFLHDTVQKGEPVSYARFEQMVRRYVEQKKRDNNFNARSEDSSLQGAAARKLHPGGNPKGNGKDTSKDRQFGDCALWSLKGQCSRGDSCSFKYDSFVKGTGTRRISRSPSNETTRNSTK